jgi:hypothetical protein
VYVHVYERDDIHHARDHAYDREVEVDRV